MDCTASERPSDGLVRPHSAKIVVAGGPGTGKSTLIGSVSDIEPLRTEAVVTVAPPEPDDPDRTPARKSTTAAVDFGRVALEESLVLYLFGLPGHDRFRFIRDDVVRGSIAAVVLTDPGRPADSLSAVDHFEECGIPFVVALNTFDGRGRFDTGRARAALRIRPDVPVVATDPRRRTAVKELLIRTIEHALERRHAPPEGRGHTASH
ncbi:GTP-binding protein [Streptomyces lavendulae]|uniref:GTP-binding protein n=1 Tax=Streptomyces lavendulae TaxID=1914 RepID=UPI00381ABE21